jgi:alginate O-acetyltransferase complex protein AlgI
LSFTSIEFAIFIAVFLLAIIIIRNQLARKFILLAASCVFYAWWDWRFLGLLATVTVIDYSIAQALINTTSVPKRKTLLWFSVAVNLGFLGFFKYFNFFIDTLNLFSNNLGWHLSTLEIILPIGISFYTFETLSYMIDVYRGVATPAKSLLDYAIFISFFPRLVAGPIMRSVQFLPQLEKGITLSRDSFFEGLQYFARGMIKKMVIADNLAIMVDQIYAAPTLFSTSSVWIGILAYSLQILYDFWGYTDMAIGIGKVIGFELPKNFNWPYISQSMTEFWTRWHISLSTWLRDYLYISLGGNRKGQIRTHINLMITMLLGGLWHGASWNFVLWGGLHGLYLSMERIFFKTKPKPHPWTSPIAYGKAFFIFILVTITWIPFRSPNWYTTTVIFQKLFFTPMEFSIEWYSIWAIILVPVIIIGGWIANRWKLKWLILPVTESYSVPVLLLEFLIVFFYAPVNSSPFIYFQF